MTTKSRRIGRDKSLDPSLLIFSAAIDYITFPVQPKVLIPPGLSATVKHATAKFDGAPVVTLHDPTAADLVRVYHACGDLPVRELEVCVDIRPRPAVDDETRKQMLASLMVDLYASGLQPHAEDLDKTFRAAYKWQPYGPAIRGFNQKLPDPTDQQLHAGRDREVQVKCYPKQRDNGKALPLRRWSARVEVRMDSRGLRARGCRTLVAVFGFGFRAQLMPLFTHVDAAWRRRSLKTRVSGDLRQVNNHWWDQHYARLFARVGVGAFQAHGGEVDVSRVRLRRDRYVNKRIGDALQRLQGQFVREKVSAFPAGSSFIGDG